MMCDDIMMIYIQKIFKSEERLKDCPLKVVCSCTHSLHAMSWFMQRMIYVKCSGACCSIHAPLGVWNLLDFVLLCALCHWFVLVCGTTLLYTGYREFKGCFILNYIMMYSFIGYDGLSSIVDALYIKSLEPHQVWLHWSTFKWCGTLHWNNPPNPHHMHYCWENIFVCVCVCVRWVTPGPWNNISLVIHGIEHIGPVHHCHIPVMGCPIWNSVT